MSQETSFSHLIALTRRALSAKPMRRLTRDVLREYDAYWAGYADRVDKCKTLQDWYEDPALVANPLFHNRDRQMVFDHFNSFLYYVNTIQETLKNCFPEARSICEFGCGIGRNVHYLAHQNPHLSCYGYELCPGGVEVARKLNQKFSLNALFAELDMVKGGDFAHPVTDVAFTNFALEQLPEGNYEAMVNILNRVNHGSIHIEPVPENYPLTYRGILGRLDHRRANYLKSFEKTLRRLEQEGMLVKIQRFDLPSSHNPLMFPTVYVVYKTSVSKT